MRARAVLGLLSPCWQESPGAHISCPSIQSTLYRVHCGWRQWQARVCSAQPCPARFALRARVRNAGAGQASSNRGKRVGNQYSAEWGNASSACCGSWYRVSVFREQQRATQRQGRATRAHSGAFHVAAITSRQISPAGVAASGGRQHAELGGGLGGEPGSTCIQAIVVANKKLLPQASTTLGLAAPPSSGSSQLCQGMFTKRRPASRASSAALCLGASLQSNMPSKLSARWAGEEALGMTATPRCTFHLSSTCREGDDKGMRVGGQVG